ncbi:MAG: beta-lactamase family protein [Acidobacteria bacterium]|nr:beta-lactamase family protein [Acidobacteriota bacterium]
MYRPLKPVRVSLGIRYFERMKNRRLPVAVALLVCGIGVGAYDLPAAQPESVGMSAERLARIGTWLRGVVEKKQAAGFVALVARKGKVVYHGAFGTRGLANAAPMTTEAIFDLASMTKPITVAAALQLLEEGRFTLADPIGEHLPEFRNARVETAPGVLSAPRSPVTVRQLFSHTSGIYHGSGRAGKFEFPTLEALAQDMAKKPLRYEPGSHWLYGDSHDVLGYLVQKISGMPLDRFVRERLLTPLGMTDTEYWPAASKDPRRAVLVVDGKDDPQSLSRVPPAAARAQTFIGGASGLYSTAADYWRFAQMLANGGSFEGKRYLGPRTIEWMTRNHIGDIPSFRTPGTRFGLGVAVVTNPGASGLPYSRGSYYWSGSQGTVFWIDPKEELVGVLMVQLTPSRLKLREKFGALVYSAILR